ncbi:MAG: GNAT family N-acetyltransferase [Candidatus Hermodarchaeota archaeon]
MTFASIQAVINERNSHPSGFTKENLAIENVERWLRSLQDRFPASVFIVARSKEKLVGWLSIEIGSTMAELGRWHPYVDPNYNESVIASNLIKQGIDYIRKDGQIRLDITFNLYSYINQAHSS